MDRSILVPLDSSVFAEHALPFALSLARRLGATLQLVHVHEPIWGMSSGVEAPVEEPTDRAMRERGLAYLDTILGRLAPVAQVPVSTALLEGDVAEAIGRHAAGAGINLIVMATHGRGPFARFWLGSAADALIRQVATPVLLVRPQEKAPELTADPAFRHILIPLDGSNRAEKILEPALALGSATKARFTLLQVIRLPIVISHDPSSGGVSGLSQSLLSELEALHRRQRIEAEQYLQRLAERLRARSLEVQTRVVIQEQEAAAILDDCQACGADLIALATRGRGGFQRLLLGSVADKVVRGAAIPVLVYCGSQ